MATGADVHRAARGFDTAGEAYERGRPTYPPAAVEALTAALGLGPGRRVLDLAAGTGKLTRLLVPTGADLVAVEPVTGMRRRLQDAVPGVEALEGTAEAIPLPAGSVDAVAVAQAFTGSMEMPRSPRSTAFCGRAAASASSGTAARSGGPGSGASPSSWRCTGGDAPPYRSNAWREAFARTRLFTQLEHERFALEHELDADGIVDRVVSVSFIAALPDDARARVASAVRELLARDPETRARERLTLHYRTDVLWCERRNG